MPCVGSDLLPPPDGRLQDRLLKNTDRRWTNCVRTDAESSPKNIPAVLQTYPATPSDYRRGAVLPATRLGSFIQFLHLPYCYSKNQKSDEAKAPRRRLYSAGQRSRWTRRAPQLCRRRVAILRDTVMTLISAVFRPQGRAKKRGSVQAGCNGGK